MKKGLSAVLVFCVLFLFISPIGAQERSADTNRLVREKILADKKLFVAENMQLTKAEAKVFWPVYESYQNDELKIVKSTQKLLDDYAKNYKVMTDVTAKRLLNDMIQIESDRLRLKTDYILKFRTVLSDMKIIRYYQLENKIFAVMNYDISGVIPLVK
jgi:hypothetical protein